MSGSSTLRDQLRKWLPHYVARYGGLPEKYLVLDIETFGFAYTDPIWQVGVVLVEDGKIVEQSDTVLDPRKTQPAGWDCAAAIERLQYSMEKNGAQCHLSLAALDNGHNPVDVFTELHALLQKAKDAKYTVITHNGLKFDLPRIAHWLDAFGKQAIVWPDNSRLDTDALIRACQFGATAAPLPKDTLESWAVRVKNRYAKGIYSSLTWCNTELGISEKYGWDSGLAHTALYDSLITHGLIEECKELLNA